MILLEVNPIDVTAVGALFIISMGLVKLLEFIIKSKFEVKANGKCETDNLLPKTCIDAFKKVLDELGILKNKVEELSKIDIIQKKLVKDVEEIKNDISLIKSNIASKESIREKEIK